MTITFAQLVVWIVVGAAAGLLAGSVVTEKWEGLGRWTCPRHRAGRRIDRRRDLSTFWYLACPRRICDFASRCSVGFCRVSYFPGCALVRQAQPKDQLEGSTRLTVCLLLAQSGRCRSSPAGLLMTQSGHGRRLHQGVCTKPEFMSWRWNARIWLRGSHPKYRPSHANISRLRSRCAPESGTPATSSIIVPT